MASAAAGEGEGAPARRKDPLVQYVVVRRDLKDAQGAAWPLGAVVAQGAHASVAAVAEALREGDAAAHEYVAPDNLGAMTKYVYGCDDEESLRKLAAKVKAKGVRYHLWLEQPENEATALAAWPARRSECQKPFKGLSFL